MKTDSLQVGTEDSLLRRVSLLQKLGTLNILIGLKNILFINKKSTKERFNLNE